MIPADDPIAQEILRSIRQLVRGISIQSKLLLRDVGLTVSWPLVAPGEDIES